MFESVMIADRSVDMRDRLYEILSHQGYKVVCVPNSNEALLELQKERPRLIVIDEHIKPDGGIAAIKKIREFDAAITIIMLSENEPDEGSETDKFAYNISEIVKRDPSSPHMVGEIVKVLKKPSYMRAAEKRAGDILIVDDESENRELLSAFLAERGFSVSAARDGEEALMKIKTSTPDIVLLDIRMPGMDGLIVLKNIRNISENIKIVILTAINDKDIIDDAFREGACDYLVKPVNLVELTELLSKLLKPA
ncbi:MAG: response regulator [Candidatus Omnitrophota bacterium]